MVTTYFGQDRPSSGSTEDQKITKKEYNYYFFGFHILDPVHNNLVMTVRTNECTQFH